MRLTSSDKRTAAGSQRKDAAAKILQKQHHKQSGAAHAKRQADAEFMPAPFQLIPAGIIDQKEQKEQRYTIKNGNQGQQFVDGIAFHPGQKNHDVLMRQGQDHIKGQNGDQKRTEKQAVFLPVPFTSAGNQFKEHLHCHLLTVP